MAVPEKEAEEGYVGKYIYKIRKLGNNGKEITIMENEEAINRFKKTVIVAVAIGFWSIIGISIIAKKIAQTIVKPVEASFEKQKQFVSDASNELKTPLAVIEANSDVLQDKVGENKWITYIQKEVQSMNKLVNDLLMLAKMENVESRNTQKFDLSKESQMAVAVFESMLYEKEIQLETNIEEGIFFQGEKEDIQQIISILFDNAFANASYAEGLQSFVKVDFGNNSTSANTAKILYSGTMTAIIIVDTAMFSSPKIFATIGTPINTKLLRKIACTMTPRLLLSGSILGTISIKSVKITSTPPAPNSINLGRNVDSKSVV